MRDFLRIASSYLRVPALAIWCFLFFCLWSVSADIGGLSGNPALELGRDQSGILSGALSRKSYLAMFAFFNACVLGILLRDQLAHPWATVLPHFREKHLLVASAITLLFLAIPMFSMEFVGVSDVARTSVAVIFLTCLAAGLWMLHHPALGILAIPFLVFVAVPASSSGALAAFLAGTTPIASAILTGTSLLALGALAWRLLWLEEDGIEYVAARVWGDLFRGQSKNIPGYFAALPAKKPITFPGTKALAGLFSNLQEVDNLRGYQERGLWQRLQLWRLGTAPARTSVSVGRLMVTTLIMMPFMMILFPGQGTVVIFSVQVMTNPFNIWLFWFMRRNRAGYESLRPRTREEFVRELGLALLWDLVQCWLGGVLFMGIASAIWAPQFLHPDNVALFLFYSGAGQLCMYAIGIWSLKQGVIARVAWALGAFLAIGLWGVWAMDGHIGFAAHIAIASVLALVSLATIPLAYQRWCLADWD